MGAGVVERARLESVCTSKGYRGFESLPIRHILLLPKHLGVTPNPAAAGSTGRSPPQFESYVC